MGTITQPLQWIKESFFSTKTIKATDRQFVEPYNPDIFQKDIHRSKATFNALIGAPGLGKTILGVQELLRFIIQCKGNAMILVPTYGMFYQVTCREMRKWLPSSIKIPRSFPNTLIDLPGGRCIFARSAEHAITLDGVDGVTFLWIDEGDLISTEVYERAKERLFRQTPGINDPRRLLVTATPQLSDEGSWLKDKVYEEYIQHNPDYYCRKAPLWESSRYSDEEKDIIRRNNPPGTWTRARYDAEWSPMVEGLVYPMLPKMGMPYSQYTLEESEEIIFGIDAGYGDPFVFGLLGRKGKVWTLFAEYRSTNQDELTIANGMLKMLTDNKVYNKWPTDGSSPRCYHDHDPNQIANVRTALLNLGIKLLFVPAEKEYKRNSVSFMRDKMLRQEFQIHENCSKGYYEFCSYHLLPSTDSNNFKTSHKTSHCPDMVRYALWSHLYASPEIIIYKQNQNLLRPRQRKIS